jgi:hypothetical protein
MAGRPRQHRQYVPAAGSDGYLTASSIRTSATSWCVIRILPRQSAQRLTARAVRAVVLFGFPARGQNRSARGTLAIIVLQEIPRRPAHLRQAPLPQKRFASTFYPRRQRGPANYSCAPKPGCGIQWFQIDSLGISGSSFPQHFRSVIGRTLNTTNTWTFSCLFH